MDIVIISQYLRNIEQLEGNNSRFIYLANLLSEKNSVEIITSNYMHGPKRHAKHVEQPLNFKITAIEEPGYPRNVCLSRFSSHARLAKNMKRYLEGRNKPDCIYCAIPSLAVASVAANYCKNNKIKFIVDIQDLWPEAFTMVFNIPVISDLIFAPMAMQANAIYRQADDIVAVSDTYCNRALQKNKKCQESSTVFLGTKLELFDQYKKNDIKYKKKDNEVWIGYCGTLGHSYDLTVVIDALHYLEGNNVENVRLIVMGDGPKREEFEKYAKEKQVKSLFMGNLEYPIMCATLAKCDIAVNPIVHGAAQSIINKHGDYAAAGIPVISTQESEEYKKLVKSYNMGFNCENGNYREVAQKILILTNNKELCKEMGNNARRCAEEKFDRKRTYEKLAHIILDEHE